MSETERYKLSFTTGGLLANECRVIAAEYLRLGDWSEARASVRADNLIQKRTASAVARISREAMDRASRLTDSELEIVVSGNAPERHQLVWLAICLQYCFVADFAEEVVREKYLSMNNALDPTALDTFFVKKSFWHGELEELKPSTKNKLRQNLFRMLREAQIVSEVGLILPQVIGDRVAKALRRRGPGSFLVYPVTDFEIESLMHA